MGRRGRRKGFTSTVTAAARAATQARDKRSAAIAQHVYTVARELSGDDAPEPMPLEAMAPLTAAAERVAQGAAKIAGLDHQDRAVVLDVAAYLVYGFREMAVGLDPEHFAAWRESAEDAVASAPQHAGAHTPTEETGNDGSSDGSTRGVPTGDPPAHDAPAHGGAD